MARIHGTQSGHAPRGHGADQGSPRRRRISALHAALHLRSQAGKPGKPGEAVDHLRARRGPSVPLRRLRCLGVRRNHRCRRRASGVLLLAVSPHRPHPSKPGADDHRRRAHRDLYRRRRMRADAGDPRRLCISGARRTRRQTAPRLQRDCRDGLREQRQARHEGSRARADDAASPTTGEQSGENLAAAPSPSHGPRKHRRLSVHRCHRLDRSRRETAVSLRR